MRTTDMVRRSGIAIPADHTVGQAARIMEGSGVGALAVLDGERLVGIVTDRDIVRRAVARDVPTDARVDAVMSTPVVTIAADADVHAAFKLFREHSCRRLAVVRDGQFVGMLTVDDVLIELASDLSDLTRPIEQEVVHAQHDAAVPARVP
jgi:CBS domain-containing protein